MSTRPDVSKESPNLDICAECVHWVENKEEGSVGRCGDCRRYPPRVMLDSEDSVMCVFPYTDHSDLCGEFKQRTQ